MMVYLAEISIPEIKKKRELILASGSGKCITCNWLSPCCLVSVFIFWILFQVTGGCWGQDEMNLFGCRALRFSGSEMMSSDQSRTFSWVRGAHTAPLVTSCYIYYSDHEWV